MGRKSEHADCYQGKITVELYSTWGNGLRYSAATAASEWSHEP